MFTTLDYVIIGFTLVCSVWAAIKGFIGEISTKFGYVFGFATAMVFTIALTPVLESKTGLPLWLSALLSYVILFLVGFLLIVLVGRMLENITESAHLGSINNILGFVLGIVEAVIIVGFFETVLHSQNIIKVTPYINKSYISREIILPVFNTLRKWVQALL